MLHTDGKTPSKITKESLEELGERLYVKIKEIVIPEWTEAFNQLALQDCIDYIIKPDYKQNFRWIYS